MGEGVEYFEIEGRSVTEVTERARRLAIAYALSLNALEHTYPGEGDRSPGLSDDHFDFFQLTAIGLAVLIFSFGFFGVVLRLIDP